MAIVFRVLRVDIAKDWDLPSDDSTSKTSSDSSPLWVGCCSPLSIPPSSFSLIDNTFANEESFWGTTRTTEPFGNFFFLSCIHIEIYKECSNVSLHLLTGILYTLIWITHSACENLQTKKHEWKKNLQLLKKPRKKIYKSPKGLLVRPKIKNHQKFAKTRSSKKPRSVRPAPPREVELAAEAAPGGFQG